MKSRIRGSFGAKFHFWDETPAKSKKLPQNTKNANFRQNKAKIRVSCKLLILLLNTGKKIAVLGQNKRF
jgi:hypothetical protein